MEPMGNYRTQLKPWLLRPLRLSVGLRVQDFSVVPQGIQV